jgi:hypothetical protein
MLSAAVTPSVLVHSDVHFANVLHHRLDVRLAVYDALWQLVQLLQFTSDDRRVDPWGHLRVLLEAGDR